MTTLFLKFSKTIFLFLALCVLAKNTFAGDEVENVGSRIAKNLVGITKSSSVIILSTTFGLWSMKKSHLMLLNSPFVLKQCGFDPTCPEFVGSTLATVTTATLASVNFVVCIDGIKTLKRNCFDLGRNLVRTRFFNQTQAIFDSLKEFCDQLNEIIFPYIAPAI